jgi:uncharacterized membrane protein
MLTVYGQLVIKWQVVRAGAFPVELADRIWFLLHLIFNPWVISGLAAGFLAFLCWVVALSEFELSYAYPFMSLTFVLVLLFSGIFFGEAITTTKVLGIFLIIAGVALGSQG